LGSKSSRLRRAAARAIVSVNAESERTHLFFEVISMLPASKPFNLFHGCIMVLKELVSLGAFAVPSMDFPSFDISTLPPPIWNDYLFVREKIAKTEFVAGPIEFSAFYYDEVSGFLFGSEVNQQLPTSALVSLSQRANDRIADSLTAQLSGMLNKDMRSMNPLLVGIGLDFLQLHPPAETDADLIANLLREDFPNHMRANLICLLQQSKSSTKTILQLLPLFDKLAFTLGEDLRLFTLHLRGACPSCCLTPWGWSSECGSWSTMARS
jgi:hypothetical protein